MLKIHLPPSFNEQVVNLTGTGNWLDRTDPTVLVLDAMSSHIRFLATFECGICSVMITNGRRQRCLLVRTSDWLWMQLEVAPTQKFVTFRQDHCHFFWTGDLQASLMCKRHAGSTIDSPSLASNHCHSASLLSLRFSKVHPTERTHAASSKDATVWWDAKSRVKPSTRQLCWRCASQYFTYTLAFPHLPAS